MFKAFPEELVLIESAEIHGKRRKRRTYLYIGKTIRNFSRREFSEDEFKGRLRLA